MTNESVKRHQQAVSSYLSCSATPERQEKPGKAGEFPKTEAINRCCLLVKDSGKMNPRPRLVLIRLVMSLKR